MRGEQRRSNRGARTSRHPRRRGDPALTWFRRECGCRLLRAWLGSDGWHVVGDTYSLRSDWASTTNSPAPARHWDLAQTFRMVLDLPLDPTEWDRDRPLLVGCDHVGTIEISTGELADHARTAGATESRIEQRIAIQEP